jgi:hypothetical protein
MKLRSLWPILLLGFSSFAHAAITLVQHTSTRCAAATTCAVTLSGVAAGNAILVFPAGAPAVLSSLVDTNGTVSTAKAWNNPSGVGAGLYYVSNTASGTHALTLTMGTSGNLELYAAEVSGLSTSAPFDIASAVASGSSVSPASASITPAGNNELLVGFISIAGSSVTFSAWGSSLTQVDTQAGGPSSAWASVVQTTGTSGSASATASASGNWVAVAAFFKPAGGCIHSGLSTTGTIAVPNGSSGSYRLANGSIGTPDCSTKLYPNSAGGIAVN